VKYSNLNYFWAVCEERRFTLAARRCGVTQPTLTNSIKRLELILGGALFLRGGNQEVQPTDLAIAIRPHLYAARLEMKRAMKVADRYRRRTVSRAKSSGAMLY
jgi:DNA-binding transcriptional LysR family regulator